MNITLYSDVLSEQEWMRAASTTWRGNSWRFGARSNANSQELAFWIMELDHDEFFAQHMMQKIAAITNQSWKLLRVYANGQTHGLSGSMHQDTNNVASDLHYTFLYYCNPEWRPEWGGQTVFKDSNSMTTVYPTPNSAVLFDATIPHCGLEPTRHYLDLRVTIAFKLEKV